MKNIIIIIGTIILGIFIFNVGIMGNTNSMKTGAEAIITRGVDAIDDMDFIVN